MAHTTTTILIPARVTRLTRLLLDRPTGENLEEHRDAWFRNYADATNTIDPHWTALLSQLHDVLRLLRADMPQQHRAIEVECADERGKYCRLGYADISDDCDWTAIESDYARTAPAAMTVWLGNAGWTVERLSQFAAYNGRHKLVGVSPERVAQRMLEIETA